MFSPAGQNKTAYAGHDVTLTCDAREYVPLDVMDWSKSEGNTEHILVYASQKSGPEIPDQNYKDRVELKVMKNGDVSLTLKSVTVEDSGTYRCYVIKQTNRRKKSIVVPKAVCTIHLNVAPPSGESVSLWIRTSSSFLVLDVIEKHVVDETLLKQLV